MFTPHALDPWLDDPHLRAAVATQATVTSTNTVLKHAVQNNSTVPQILLPVNKLPESAAMANILPVLPMRGFIL
ncbi:hypothetical protein PZ03_03480, partial [Lacticaseibacillus rhamnosus]